MKKIKKLVTVALACTLIFGAAMTTHAADPRTVYVNCVNKSCSVYNAGNSPFDDCSYCGHHCRYCGSKWGTSIKCPTS